MKKCIDTYFPIVFLYALSGYFLWDTADFTPDSLMYPRGLAILLIILTTLLLAASLMKKAAAMAVGEEGVRRQFWVIFSFSLLYGILMQFLGFVVSSLIFCPLTALSLGYKRRGMALCVSIATVALIYVGFKVLLKVPLPTVTLFGITL